MTPHQVHTICSVSYLADIRIAMVRLVCWAGIPFGIWLAFRCNAGLHGLWYGLTVALVYGAVVSVWMGLHVDWNKESEKVQKRLEAVKANQDEHGRHSGGGERV